MPQRPKRPCRRPGCGELVDQGYCATHAEDSKSYDRWRGTAKSRGYDADWAKVRVLALERDSFLCVLCQRDNQLTPAVDVDHIHPISKRPDLRLDLSNLQSLCRACHSKKTKQEQRY